MHLLRALHGYRITITTSMMIVIWTGLERAQDSRLDECIHGAISTSRFASTLQHLAWIYVGIQPLFLIQTKIPGRRVTIRRGWEVTLTAHVLLASIGWPLELIIVALASSNY